MCLRETLVRESVLYNSPDYLRVDEKSCNSAEKKKFKKKEKSSARTYTSQSKTEGRNYERKNLRKKQNFILFFFSLEDNKEVASDAETNGIIHISQVGYQGKFTQVFFFFSELV